MTDQEAATVVGYLMASTTGWNDDSADVYISEVSAWGDVDAAVRAAKRIARTWTESWRPTLGVLENAYHEERSATHARTVVPGAGCGGSGWKPVTLHSDDGERTVAYPCPTCNPVLAELQHDRDLWDRWLAGVPLSKLVDGVEAVNGTMTLPDGQMPAPCLPAVDSDAPEAGADRRVDPLTGRRIAYAEYADEAERQGRRAKSDREFGLRVGA